jgi:hypothetical protein
MRTLSLNGVPRDFLALMGRQAKWEVERIYQQNDLNRRIGSGRDSVECLKRKYLLRLPVVQKSKVLRAQAGNWLARFVGHRDIEVDEALHPVRRGREDLSGPLNLRHGAGTVFVSDELGPACPSLQWMATSPVNFLW